MCGHAASKLLTGLGPVLLVESLLLVCCDMTCVCQAVYMAIHCCGVVALHSCPSSKTVAKGGGGGGGTLGVWVGRSCSSINKKYSYVKLLQSLTYLPAVV